MTGVELAEGRSFYSDAPSTATGCLDSTRSVPAPNRQLVDIVKALTSNHTLPLAARSNPCQLAGLRAVTIHAAPSIITDRSPGRSAKAARTAAEARARMSSG